MYINNLAFADYQVRIDSRDEQPLRCFSGLLQAGMDLMPDNNPVSTPYLHIGNVQLQYPYYIISIPESIEIPNIGMVPTPSLTAYLSYVYTDAFGIQRQKDNK